MSTKEFDYLVFIGRFQPLHVGHQHVIDQALERADHVIILVGSANTARSSRNPFTYDERRLFIEATYHSHAGWGQRLSVRPINDSSSDNRWKEQVQRQVTDVIEKTATTARFSGSPRVGLVGFAKDHSSYYLKMFPQWESLDVAPGAGLFNATDIRNGYFQPVPVIPRRWLSPAVEGFMERFVSTPQFAEILVDVEYVRRYQKSWASAPFPPTFITVDAVCIQSGHVLLIQRGGHPGFGQWALPGGFVDQKEVIRDAAIRELREETKISDHMGEMPPAKLASFMQEDRTRIFDDPNRSARGRTVTFAHYFEFPDAKPMFGVKGSDDASAARWVPLADLDPSQMYEDHYLILEDMLNLKGAN